MVFDLEHVMDLRAGENSHQTATLWAGVVEGADGVDLPIYHPDIDLGGRVRLPGWTNIGDMSAVLRASIGMGEVYAGTDTPHVAVASKHTRPVVLAVGRTQLEAVVKALAGDINSPFGGFWGLNTPLTEETAVFLNRMFIEGVVAPGFEGESGATLGANERRFLVETPYRTSTQLNVLGQAVAPLVGGYFLLQDRDSVFNARAESSVVTGDDPHIDSLGPQAVANIHFACNAAGYLSSNLIFYVQNGAIAGLGDGCGARVVAARKARGMLEDSVYAAVSDGSDGKWARVLADTPFSRDDFEDVISSGPLNLTCLSDAFFPHPDGMVEATGIDRIHPEFGQSQVTYGRRTPKTLVLKRDNFRPGYDAGLVPTVLVQPGGSIADRAVLGIGAQYGNFATVFTMSPELLGHYKAGRKDPTTGRKPTGKRFFGHIVMA